MRFVLTLMVAAIATASGWGQSPCPNGKCPLVPSSPFPMSPCPNGKCPLVPSASPFPMSPRVIPAIPPEIYDGTYGQWKQAYASPLKSPAIGTVITTDPPWSETVMWNGSVWVPTKSGPSLSAIPPQSPVRVNATPKSYWWAAWVHVDKGGGYGDAGSGTPIHTEQGKTLILTNAHVVPRDSANRPISVTVNGIKYPARYVDGSEVVNLGPSLIDVRGPDLCLLEINAELKCAVIAADPPAPGEAVSQWGYGGTRLGQPPVLRYGRISQSPGLKPDELLTSHRNVSGDSGAGLFDSQGELCGVVCGNQGGQGRVVGLTTVKRFAVRPIVHRLFPRLADKLAAKRLTAPPAAPTTKGATAPPEVPPAKK